MTRQNNHDQVPFEIRCAIITLSSLCGWKNPTIARVPGFDVSSQGIGQFIRHTIDSARIATQIEGDIPCYILLQYCQPSKRKGRPRILDPKGKTAFRQLLLDNNQDTFMTVVDDNNIPISRKTAHTLAKEPSPDHPLEIGRLKRPNKPILSSIDADTRISYTIWLQRTIHNRLYQRVIFIMSDETPLFIGGPPRSSEYITAYVGTDANTFATHSETHPKFTLQFLGACCSDLTITRPYKVWVLDDKDERDDIKGEITRAQQEVKKQLQKELEEAKDKSSKAYQKVIQANIEMNNKHRKDLEDKRTGKKKGYVPKTKKPLRAEQVFKFDKKDFKRTAEKGMDWAWYAYNWLVPHLYPYYHKVKRANPDCQVYLIKDNSPVHTRARRFLQLINHPELEGIEFAPHPANSPDLHPIERVFDFFKKNLNIYVEGASKKHKDKAGGEVTEEWRDAEAWESKIAMMTDNQRLLERAEKCQRAQGYNLFHG